MKTSRYLFVFLLANISRGLLVPVLSFMLVDKGIALSDIGLALGAYAVTAVLLEVPSGIAADLYGKRKVYIVSLLVGIGAYLVLLIGSGFIWVIAGVVLLGAARALSSGTLEALFVSRYQQARGEENLPGAMRILSVSEAAGLAVGALMGGFLPSLAERYFHLSGPYDPILLLQLILGVILMGMVPLLIRTDRPEADQARPTLRSHVLSSVAVMRSNRNIGKLFVAMIGIGFVLCSLEAYWQPQFATLIALGRDPVRLAGLLSVAYLGSIIAGNLLSEWFLTKRKVGYKSVFLVSRFVMLACLAIAAVSRIPILFAVSYCLLYMTFGISNVSEGSLINRGVPDKSRASILSTQSLVLQIGFLSASGASKVLVGQFSIQLLWLVAGIFAVITMLPALSLQEQKGGSDAVAAES